MSIPQETLMRYVDGELEPSARAAVEAAMRDDPEIERSVAQMRHLRTQIERAYAAELAAPVPERLLAPLRQPSRTPGSAVAELAAARNSAARKAVRTEPGGTRWRYFTSMAASLLVAVGAGYFVWHRSQSVMIKEAGGSLVASGALAGGLSDQLAGEANSSAVDIGVSFRAKSGDYCRTFSISAGTAEAGLACRHANQWEIRVLTQVAEKLGRGADYRTAGSSLSPAILAAIQDQIAGEPLDRAAEIAARRQRWRSPGK